MLYAELHAHASDADYLCDSLATAARESAVRKPSSASLAKCTDIMLHSVVPIRAPHLLCHP